MTNTSANNNRIAKNTMLLYFRMIVIMAVTLFTSRVILQTLGVEDYGIYNVVGGIVAMFTFISSSLTTASQRFITFELGKGKKGNISNVFSTCLTLHILLAILIAIIVEPFGIWFIYNKLMIPEARLTAAIWVFQFSILAMVVMIVSVPYNALIVAYEKMNAFALVSVIDAALRLAIAYSLLAFNSLDKLIVYGALVFLAQLIIRACYTVYCNRTFTDVQYCKQMDRSLLLEMGKFASWSIFGNVAFLTYTQGLNLLLGMFFSPVVNAARGVAVQIQGAVNTFVSSFQTAINPQITKNYAAGNFSEMINLVFRSSRFSFYLLMMLSVPVLLRTSDILSIWLVNVPEHTVTFVRIILITTWINSIANPLIISVKATGKIKLYESTVGGLMIAILPISYIFLRFGYSPEIVFVVHLIVECIAMVFRIWNTKSLIHFSLREYATNVLIRISAVGVASFAVSYLISTNLSAGLLVTIIVFTLSVFVSAITILLIGLDTSERTFILNKIRRIR
ncbi:hypothetical protein IX296_000652 [Bacteroides pyogenes]|nr:hypothetical protein [Bacteroides pyogenes]MBR8737778.1 hypothetical protein [Bacteroides pyogenes]MBR8753449.1 hypothetical protein [Bacteroides pyogenes]MBR8794877.1 hypothetical protein [Bacteroides pyogenes]MBR8808386.1 hypothetical protein [Bacteroides pyogenes]